MADASLPNGRELDALVAEKVMGWIDIKKQSIANAFGQHVMDDYVGQPSIGATQPVLVPRYSTMIQEAGKVPVQRDALYRVVCEYPRRGATEPASAPATLEASA